jgi:hypothetical protein
MWQNFCQLVAKFTIERPMSSKPKEFPKRICIVGNAGSGKTRLAIELHKKLGLPLIHLDHYYWLPNWQRVGLEKFTEIQDELCKKEAWIMEGPYVKILKRRVIPADMVIFLDMPTYRCMWNVIKRSLLNLGKELPGSPQGCKQNFFSFKFLSFLHWVWNFNRQYHQMILDILCEFEGKKEIYILRTYADVDRFLKKVGK